MENIIVNQNILQAIQQPSKMIQLGQYLRQLDEKHNINRSDIDVNKIHSGIEQITANLVEMVGRKDKRFEGRLIKMGSFYDELKVMQPDEFDFLLEINGLSHEEIVGFRPT